MTTDPVSQAVTRGDTAIIELWYPRDSPVKHIEVGLMDVRAADSVRLSYDFDRDGWIVEQARLFAWDGSDLVCDQDWQEVAFIQAWGRRETEEEQQQRLGCVVSPSLT